jgi:hypothetical protein
MKFGMRHDSRIEGADLIRVLALLENHFLSYQQLSIRGGVGAALVANESVMRREGHGRQGKDERSLGRASTNRLAG